MGMVKGKSEFNLREHFAQEKERLKTMSFREKIDHIWTYYKYYMLSAFCVLFIVGGALISFFMPREQILIAGVQCNIRASDEGYDYLTDVFQDEVLKSDKGKTVLHTLEFYGQGTVDAVTHTTEAYYSVNALVEAKELDYMLVDDYSMQYFGNDRLYMDLREILSAEELAQLDEKGLVIYEESEETGTVIPRAIDITNMPFCKEELELKSNVCYLIFVRNTPRKDNCLLMWQHIKNYK